MMAHRSVYHIYCKGLTRERNIINNIDEKRSNKIVVNSKKIYVS